MVGRDHRQVGSIQNLGEHLPKVSMADNPTGMRSAGLRPVLIKAFRMLKTEGNQSLK